MKKQKKENLVEQPSKVERAVQKNGNAETEFSDSISRALRQKNERGIVFGIVAIVTVIVLLVVAALSDILTLCFQLHPIFGYTVSVLTAILIVIFIVRPVCKVVGARSFVTDVTGIAPKELKKRNAKALKEVSKALVEYNTDPKNAKFRYLGDENVKNISLAVSSGDKKQMQEALKRAYGGEVGSFANSLIFKSAGKVFLRTSISQNDKIDALSVLLVNLSLVKQIVGVYGYRPSQAKLLKIYVSVLRNALIAYGMENVNWFNVFGKFFSGVAKKIPFVDTVVDSAVQGTVSAFLTILVGYKTKRYLCSDYKKQEKLDEKFSDGEFGDEEVKIASALAREIRKDKASKAAILEEDNA
ncbi:MAG: DUF697 domain-containing protein [Clostridia bacterium]|nr:DUF697 domain-containing protein [Clostridia bacterium]